MIERADTWSVVPDAPPALPKMELRGVSKKFQTRRGEVVALTECDLAIQKAEFVTVVGPSGCGKSTLMMIAAGLTEPSTGDILVDGRPAGAPGPKRSVVFQRFALFPSETAAQNIEFGLRVAGIDKAEREARVQEQLALMGLEQFRHAYPSELSGGMQQRVAIARAFVFDPAVLLMDEPFSALDEMNRDKQRMGLLEFWQSNRKSVMFVTHSVPEAIMLSDRIILMAAHPGRIAEIIDVDLPRPRDESVYATDAFRDLEGYVRKALKSVMEPHNV